MSLNSLNRERARAERTRAQLCVCIAAFWLVFFAKIGSRVSSYMRSLPAAALAFARRGPLWHAVRNAGSADEWAFHGCALVDKLLPDDPRAATTYPEELDTALASRVYHLYLPVFFWCRGLVRSHQSGGRALAIGLSAPQGRGKTTLVDFLADRFAADSLACAAVSFDDFYLTGKAQDDLAAGHADNPLFQVRGNAGTHDVPLGTETLRTLIGGPGAAQQGSTRVVQYDKSARGGRGDRAVEDAWTHQRLPLDMVLLEGWMAGFKPLPATANVLQAQPGLQEVNSRLGAYDAWHDQMDAWVIVAADRPEHVFSWRLQAPTSPYIPLHPLTPHSTSPYVFSWRLQAEQAMAARGKPGMTDAQVRDFVDRYMPAYQAYLPALHDAATDGGVDGKPTLRIDVDGSRSPVQRGAGGVDTAGDTA